MSLDALPDEWTIRQTSYDADRAGVYETLFTVGNGRLAARGAHEEGHRGARPGSFIAGVYDAHDSIVIDLVNAPGWSEAVVTVDGVRLDVDTCTVVSHERALDISRGVLHRITVFEDPDGRRTRLATLRTACMHDRDLAVLRVEATPLGHTAEIRISTGVDGDRANLEALPVYPAGRTFTPAEKLAKWARSRHLRTESTDAPADGTLRLTTRTIGSRVTLAFAAALSFDRDPDRIETIRSADDVAAEARWTAVADGDTVRLDKFAAVRTSRDVDAAAGEDLAKRAARIALAARTQGVEALLAASASVWEELWDGADAEVLGDANLTQAVRFGIYHLLITVNPDDPTVNIGAKSLSGEGYRGHVFWDTEAVMLPFYLLTDPAAAKALLGYRFHTLPGARRNALAEGHRGARFAWEAAATGDEECPTRTPDGTDRFWTREEEVHVTADVAYAIRRYAEATLDRGFLHGEAAEVLFDTSVFWESYIQQDADGSLHMRSVMGPDEFHSHIDDNAFTNFVVSWHLRYAADVFDEIAERDPERIAELTAALEIDETSPARWRDIADRIARARENADGVIEQFTGFFDLVDVPVTEWDENDMPRYPEGYNHFNCTGTQLLKQPDVLQTMLMFPEAFSPEQRRANFEYYEPRTLHKSSLSPSVHATIGISVGDRTRALQYFTRSALVDIADNQGNTREGMHIASAAGTWSTLVNGFGGLETGTGEVAISPWIPDEWEGVRYRLSWRGFKLRVQVDRREVRIGVSGPEEGALRVLVEGTPVELAAGEETVVSRGDAG